MRYHIAVDLVSDGGTHRKKVRVHSRLQPRIVSEIGVIFGLNGLGHLKQHVEAEVGCRSETMRIGIRRAQDSCYVLQNLGTNRQIIRACMFMASEAVSTQIAMPVRKLKKYSPHKHDEHPQQHLHVGDLKTCNNVAKMTQPVRFRNL